MTIQPLAYTHPAPEHRATRDEAALMVRANSTCAGAHVHVGSLRMKREELPAFAERYQERQEASLLAALTASAVNDIQGTLAPRMGVRIYSVVAAASAGLGLAADDIALNLSIESPDAEPAVRDVVEAWQLEYAATKVSAATSLQIAVRLVNWYGTS